MKPVKPINLHTYDKLASQSDYCVNLVKPMNTQIQPKSTLDQLTTESVQLAFELSHSTGAPLSECLIQHLELLRDSLHNYPLSSLSYTLEQRYDVAIKLHLKLNHTPTPGRVVHLFLYPYTRALAFKLTDLSTEGLARILDCTAGHARGAILLIPGAVEPLIEPNVLAMDILAALNHAIYLDLLDHNVVGAEYQGVVYPTHGRNPK